MIHPIPDRHIRRVRRSVDQHSNTTQTLPGLHVLYKRSALGPNSVQEEFCGIDSTITSDDLSEDEAGVVDDVFVVGQRLVQESDLVVSFFFFFEFLVLMRNTFWEIIFFILDLKNQFFLSTKNSFV